MKKSQSIKNINSRLLQFAIEDYQDIAKPSKRASSKDNSFIRTSTTLINTAPSKEASPKNKTNEVSETTTIVNIAPVIVEKIVEKPPP